IWTRWAAAGGRSKERRYYMFVLVGTNALDELLVSKGFGSRVCLVEFVDAAEQEGIGLQQLDRITLAIAPAVIECFRNGVPEVLLEKADVALCGNAITLIAQHCMQAEKWGQKDVRRERDG